MESDGETEDGFCRQSDDFTFFESFENGGSGFTGDFNHDFIIA